ncbi:MAG: RIP metalloprotease RseP, partial [Gemmatirosa sp.]
AVIDSVVAGRPAALAGLQRGDSVTAVDGTPVRTWSEVVERVSSVTDRAVTMDVARAGAVQRLTVTPRAEEATDPITNEKRRVGRIGVLPRDSIAREPVGIGTAIREGANETWYAATSVVSVVRGLFTRDVAVSNLGGPIAIARTSVQAAKMGFEPLLRLLAFLSINIAVLNLLPIPVLDGGQVLMNVAESIKGGAFSLRTRENILRVGLVAIGLLFVTVMWNDLARLAQDFVR